MVENWRRVFVVFVLFKVCILGWRLSCINAVTDPSDASALNVMYSSLNSSSQLTQWSATGGDPCGQSWKGVICSGQRVTELKLSGLGLSGSMGYQLSSLSALTNLDLSNNNLGGDIPYSLPQNLERLNFADNQFTGNVPYSISQMKALKYLNIGHNHLQGQLNDMFGQLASLSTLDLSVNTFSGNLPESFSSLSSLSSLYLQNNQFSGTIDVLANLPLDNLNIANNFFTGWIPNQLKNINLQKDGNNWSSGPAPPSPPGTPPASENSPKHKFDNNNSPSESGGGSKKSGIGGGGIAGILISLFVVGGIVAFFLVKRRRSRRSSLDIEKLDNQSFAPLAASSNETHEMKPVQSSSSIKTKTFDTAVSINLRPPPIDRHKSFDEEDFSKKPIAVKKAVKAPTNVASYSIADLQMATGSFNVENLLGEGTFGRVYRAQFDDGKVLAVKKIDSSALPGEMSDDFNEIVSNISQLRHPNIMELVGYCSEYGQHLLVYEFCKNGSLHDFMHLSDEDNKPLIWNTRVKIALGTARALEYLHEVCSPSVVHKNIKSANILLDNEFNPHLSDCGLASNMPNADEYDISFCLLSTTQKGQKEFYYRQPVCIVNYSTLSLECAKRLPELLIDLEKVVAGGKTSHDLGWRVRTMVLNNDAGSGYSAPEVAMSGQYTIESDVYSFGIVMLELLTGRKPFDSSRPRLEQSLVRWATPQLHDIDALAKMVDPELKGLYPVKSLSRFADVIALCVQPEPEFRPPMSEVVQALVRLVQRANMSKRTIGNDQGPTTPRGNNQDTQDYM